MNLSISLTQSIFNISMSANSKFWVFQINFSTLNRKYHFYNLFFQSCCSCDMSNSSLSRKKIRIKKSWNSLLESRLSTCQ